jgi:hypothetical protein
MNPENPMSFEHTLELRCLSAGLLREYLEALGGMLQPDGRITGKGWEAELTPMQDHLFGTMRFKQLRFTWRGDLAAEKEIWPRMMMRLVRGGG